MASAITKSKNKLGSFWLFSDTDNGTELFKRKYVKIQLLLAEIGGFMNFLFTFGGYIVHSYNNNQYYNKLMTHYYPEDSCSNSDFPIKNSNKMDLIFNNLKVLEVNKEIKNHMKNLHENSSSKIKSEEKSIRKLNNNFVNNINDTKKIRNIEYLSKISELNNLSGKCNKLENKSEISDSISNKETNDVETLRSELQPNIQYINDLRKKIDQNNVSMSYFLFKVKDDDYCNRIDENTYNNISTMFIGLFCSCSKKFMRKLSYLNSIKDNIVEKMDIRNYLRIQFEIEMIKKTLYDGNKLNHNIDSLLSFTEEPKYEDFAKKFDLFYDEKVEL